MKIKLDENLPASLVPVLKRLGHEADSVWDENLSGAEDREVWQAAQRERRLFITQDLDFSDVRQFKRHHHGIVLVRLRDPGRLALRARIETVFAAENVAVWPGKFIVVTDKKIRIRTSTQD